MINPGRDPEEFLYSCRDHLNASSRLEGPTDRQCEVIISHILSPKYESIPRAYLEMPYVCLAEIRQMMAAIFADNLSCRSITSAEIGGPSGAK